jgi:hypothetical protein
MRTLVLLPFALFASSIAPAIVPGIAPVAAQQLTPAPFARYDPVLPVSGLVADKLAEPSATRRSVRDFQATTDGPDTGALVLAGLVGGAAGLFGGAVVGGRLQRSPCEDCFEGALAGAVLGESLAIPLAVHFVDRRRGQPLPGMVSSLAIAAGGIFLAAELRQGPVLLAIPVVQLAAAIASERHTARRQRN